MAIKNRVLLALGIEGLDLDGANIDIENLPEKRLEVIWILL
ncbi:MULTISPECIES: hypothetical protein [Bacillus]|nr:MULTISPECIES: hypothetical protein [Bacillus]MCR4379970.1 hypothetical protein [Bacillus subtilis]MDV3520380.1 hypothetical protein [Bacillus subtilis subsp. subtilis]UWJ02848.1 hypothetical protein N0B18_08275 [Bacillus subtilis]WKB64699.1 hypothetical protein QYC34_09040 [Bacillus subtilis]WOP25060.1 hypothetical protein R0Q54_18320 [Bacillus subtilis]